MFTSDISAKQAPEPFSALRDAVFRAAGYAIHMVKNRKASSMRVHWKPKNTYCPRSMTAMQQFLSLSNNKLLLEIQKRQENTNKVRQ
jgi:hypothetical protein